MIAAILFFAAGLSVFYVLLGYPLLLEILARYFPKPICKQDHYESVSVIIPVRNGEQWLGRKIESVLALDYPAELREIMIVSDGSTDATEAIAAGYADRGVRLIKVPAGGKPAALNAAVPLAKGELLFLTDVRQVLRRDCLRRLVACMADPKVGVVSGNLQIALGETEEEQNTGLYWRYENWIRRNLARVDSMLGATGPVQVVRHNLYVPIPEDSLLDDVYLPLSIHLQGYRLVLEEEAIAIDEPTGLGSEFRRKVRTQAGIVQLITSFPGTVRIWKPYALSFPQSEGRAPVATLPAGGNAGRGTGAAPSVAMGSRRPTDGILGTGGGRSLGEAGQSCQETDICSACFRGTGALGCLGAPNSLRATAQTVD